VISALLRSLLIAAIALLAVGCATTGGMSGDDDTGDLGEVQEKRPGDIYAQLGQQYMTDGQPAVALRKLKRGLTLDPDNPQIHAVMGLLYQRLGETGPARSHFSEAISLEPRNPYYRNLWGSFLCQQRDFAEADEQFRLALKNPLYNKPWSANTNAGLCAYQSGDVEKAETYLRQALSINPAIPQALLKMSRINFDRGDFVGAKRYLERYRSLVPHNAETLLLGLRIEHQMGSRDGMERYLAVLRHRFPDAPETRLAEQLSRQ